MNKYPLGRMLAVRELREDQALRELRLRMAALDTATALWEAAEQTVLDCRDCLRAKDAELSAATLGLKVDKGRTLSLRRELDAWRNRVEQSRREAEEARKAVETARQACDKARNAYQGKMKDKLKISNHKDIWLTEDAKAVEAAAEIELEDVRKAPNGPTN